MRNRPFALLCAIAAFIVSSAAMLGQDYATMTPSQAQKIGKEMTVQGHVDGASWRVYSTNKATSYQYRVTWLTPSVIKATARLEQFRQRLTNAEVQQMIDEAENAGPTVFLVELDAIEGSGVIPPDWQAFLQQEGLPVGDEGCMKGQSTPELWKVKGLVGTMSRDYKYDRFWIVFPLLRKNGQQLFSAGVKKAELIIRINDKEDKAIFKIPEDILEKSRRLSEAAAH
jgi:hypothetical protein